MIKTSADFSLRTKLIISFVAVALIPLFLANLVTMRTADQSIIHTVFETNQKIAESLAADIDRMFADKIRMLKITAENTYIRSTDAERVVPALRLLTTHDPELLMAIVLTANGHLIARSDGKQDSATYSDRAYFHTAASTGVTTISDVLVSKTTGKLDIVIAEPIKNMDQSIFGLLVIGVDLQKIIDRIAETKIGTTGYAYVVNKNGHVLMHPEHDLVENAADFSDLAPVKSAISGHTGWVIYEFHGQETLSSYSYMPTTGWGLIVQQPLNDAISAAVALRNTNIVIMAITMIISVIIVFALAGIIFKPISLLTAAAKKVAEGDLTAQTSFKSLDEMGTLSSAFNYMISQLRAREDALQESQEKYRRIVVTSNEGIWVLDEKHRLSFVNDRMSKILGYRIEEMIDQDVESFLFDDDLPDHWKHMNDRRQGVSEQYERRWKHRDGHAVWTIVSATALFDAMHHFSGSFAMITDISKRIGAEALIKQSEKRFRAYFENAPVGMAIVDTQKQFLEVNSQTCRILGYQSEELLGHPFHSLIHPDDREGERDRWQQILEGNMDSDHSEKRYIHKNGRLLWLIVSNTLIRDNMGKPLYFLSHLIDITDPKEAQADKLKLEKKLQQSQKIEAIGTLAGGVAHDFNNLLMGIQGRVSLLSLDMEDSHPKWEHIHAIDEYVRSATSLTKQLLGFARGGKYEVKPFDINELVLSSSAMFGRTKKEIRIHTRCSQSSLVVEADRGQIEQVLLNLYINAWQAMPPDGGELYLETNLVTLDEAYCKPHKTEPGNYVHISITDTGAGMDEATRHRIFDPFFTTREKSHGTGLGLASAYGIIKNHGGIITVYSDIGHGSTFNIYLVESGKEANRKDIYKDSGLIRGSGTLLLIDDEDMILEVTQAMLKSLGYHVIIARGGQEAIDAICNTKINIDMVILDMIMPGMDGGTTFDRIHEIHPEIPILLSSGYAINSQANEIIQRGCSGFIQKPYNISELSSKVHQMLREK